jgi:hypothetical protein
MCLVVAGVPIIADSKFMAAYSMIEPNSVYYQEDGKNELDVMFEVARMTTDEMWRTRLGRQDLEAKVQDVGQHWSKICGLHFYTVVCHTVPHCTWARTGLL